MESKDKESAVMPSSIELPVWRVLEKLSKNSGQNVENMFKLQRSNSNPIKIQEKKNIKDILTSYKEKTEVIVEEPAGILEEGSEDLDNMSNKEVKLENEEQITDIKYTGILCCSGRTINSSQNAQICRLL